MKSAKIKALTTLFLVLLSTLFTVPASASNPCQTSPGPRSEIVGSSGNEELFLGGNYIELGISRLGNFGTSNNHPASFYGRAGASPTKIGMVADYDGFNCALDYPIDFFLPGSPEERYNFGFDVSGTKEYVGISDLASVTKSSGINNVTPSDVEISNLSSGNTLKGKVITTLKDANSSSIARITQVISFELNNKYFTNTVTIENLSNSTWTSARFQRNVDPDNAVDQGADFTTDNEVIATIAADGKAVVRAQLIPSDSFTTIPTNYQNSLAPLLYYSTDSDAKVSTFGFSNSDPYQASAYDSARAKNDLNRNDQAINITTQKTNISSGSSFSFVYVTSLDERDFNLIDSEINQAASAPATSSSTSVTSQNPQIANAYDALIAEVLTFAPLSSKLTDKAKLQIKNAIETNPSPSGVYKITGYVQGIGGNKNNSQLSLARANAVYDYLKSISADQKFTFVIEVGGVPSTNGKKSSARKVELTKLIPVVK